MKKLLIGALVGGILVFLWQTLSWTVLDQHGKEYRKAPAQDSIINYLSTQLEEGQYTVPTIDRTASSEEMEKFTENIKGKPWAIINYHKAYDANMFVNIIRGLIAALIAALCVCWVLMKKTHSSFLVTFVSTLLIGVAGYLFIPYAGHTWFQSPGATTNLVDVLVSWGLCGIWFGWWLNKKDARDQVRG